MFAVPQQAGHRYAGTGAKTSDIEIDGAAKYGIRASPHAERASVRPRSHLFGRVDQRLHRDTRRPLMNRAGLDFVATLPAKQPAGRAPWPPQDVTQVDGRAFLRAGSMCWDPAPLDTQRPDQTRLGRWQQFREHGEVIAPGSARLSAASMSMPITWPLGASRSCPWQASSTSQASCSWRLIKACSR